MNTALYYPTHPSMNWLRLAALCWDRVLHLPPTDVGVTPTDSYALYVDIPEEISRLSAACGGVFIATERDDPQIASFFEELDGLMLRLIEGRETAGEVDAERTTVLTFIVTKAGEIARDLKADLVTDHPTYAAIAASGETHFEGALAFSVLEAHLPADLERIPVERLAELRIDMTTGRMKYQRDIHALVKEFSEITSEDEGTRLTRLLAALAHERIDETRRAYRRAKLEGAPKAMGVSALPPAIISSLSSTLGIGIFAPAGIVSGIAAGVAAHLVTLEKARDDKARTGWSYVLDVGDALKAPSRGLVPPRR